MKSEELIMLLIIGGGVILPIMGIVIAISRIEYKNERRFSEKDLNENVKNYISDDNNRRRFSVDDKKYYRDKRKKGLVKRFVIEVLWIFLAVFWLIYNRVDIEHMSYAFPVLICSVIALVWSLMSYMLRIIRQPKVNVGWIIKGYIYKYIKITGRKAGIRTFAFIIYYDYTEMKYKTCEINDLRIGMKEKDEKTGCEFVELVCKEKKQRLKVYDVLS